MRTGVLIVLTCIFGSVILGQTKSPSRRTYVRAPLENTFLTVAVQSRSPLVIEDAQLLLSTERTWDFMFDLRLRNRSTKVIRNAQLHFWTTDGSGGTLSTPFRRCGELQPGSTFGTCGAEPDIVVVPLTSQLRDKLNLGLPMKQIVVLYVESVEFTDGTLFSEKMPLKALREFFDMNIVQK